MLSYASQLYLTSEAAYPYTSGSTGVNGACRVNASSAPAPGSLKLSGSGYYTAAADATSIMTAVTTAPVVIYFYVDVSLGGIWGGDVGCPPGARRSGCGRVWRCAAHRGPCQLACVTPGMVLSRYHSLHLSSGLIATTIPCSPSAGILLRLLQRGVPGLRLQRHFRHQPRHDRGWLQRNRRHRLPRLILDR